MLPNCASLLVLIVSLLFSLGLSSINDENPKYSRGAITTLIKGNKKSDFDDLILRNKSILKNLYLPLNGDKNSTRNQYRMKNLDIVCFYENVTNAKLRKYIQSKTPELPIIFKPIQFDGHAVYEDAKNVTAKLVYPHCPQNPTANIFRLNYRNMCRFWFIGFLDYVQEYDWIWRLDSDCEVLGNVRNILPVDYSHLIPKAKTPSSATASTEKKPQKVRIDGNIDVDRYLSTNDEDDLDGLTGDKCIVDYSEIFVSSPSWTPLDQQYYDEITPKGEGAVVTGLGTFTRDFAKRNGMLTSGPSDQIDSMYAPYTNSVFFNLKWLRGENYVMGYKPNKSDAKESHSALVRKYLKEVDESNCIYSNRWGDMPMIGAAMSVVKQPVHWLKTPYNHESHHILLDDDAESGTFRATFGELFLVVFTDNDNDGDLNTRISYKK